MERRSRFVIVDMQDEAARGGVRASSGTTLASWADMARSAADIGSGLSDESSPRDNPVNTDDSYTTRAVDSASSDASRSVM